MGFEPYHCNPAFVIDGKKYCGDYVMMAWLKRHLATLQSQANMIKGCPGVETCEYSSGKKSGVCCHKACAAIKKEGFTYRVASQAQRVAAKKRSVSSCTMPSNNKPGVDVVYDPELWGTQPLN